MSEVRRVINEVENFTGDVIRRMALEITNELLRPPSEGGTPVDTGWARANWVPSIGVSFDMDLRGVTPDASDVARAGGQQEAGIASLLGYTIELGEVFISNNVPYIVRLNDGSSTQAPAMFVETAIERGVRGTLERIASR